MLSENLFKLLQVHIALERKFKLGIFSLINGAVHRKSGTPLYMTFSGVKVGVARNNIALLYKVAEKYILSSTPLVGGDNVFEAGNSGDSLL